MSEKTPVGLGKRGANFWKSATAVYTFEAHELELLAEACRVLDRLDELEGLVAVDGLTIEGSTGQRVLHPAIGEQRQQRLVLDRLVRALQIPAEARPSSSEIGQAAAMTRWSKERRVNG